MEDKVQQYIGEVRTNKSGNDLLRKIGDNLWILISKEQYDTEKKSSTKRDRCVLHLAVDEANLNRDER